MLLIWFEIKCIFVRANFISHILFFHIEVAEVENQGFFFIYAEELEVRNKQPGKKGPTIKRTNLVQRFPKGIFQKRPRMFLNIFMISHDFQVTFSRSFQCLSILLLSYFLL